MVVDLGKLGWVSEVESRTVADRVFEEVGSSPAVLAHTPRDDGFLVVA